MKTINNLDLEKLVGRINRLTGQPETPYKRSKGKLLAQAGAYLIDKAYGKYAVHQITSETGGRRTIIDRCSKNALYLKMQTFINGIEAAQREA